jgi:hypothetical protein
VGSVPRISWQETFKQSFAGLLKYHLVSSVADGPIEIWFQDEARVGQKGTHAYVWAPIGSRPPMVRDNRHGSAKMVCGRARGRRFA